MGQFPQFPLLAEPRTLPSHSSTDLQTRRFADSRSGQSPIAVARQPRAPRAEPRQDGEHGAWPTTQQQKKKTKKNFTACARIRQASQICARLTSVKPVTTDGTMPWERHHRASCMYVRVHRTSYVLHGTSSPGMPTVAPNLQRA